MGCVGCLPASPSSYIGCGPLMDCTAGVLLLSDINVHTAACEGECCDDTSYRPSQSHYLADHCSHMHL